MKIEVNIEKRYLVGFILVIGLLVVAGFVFAYGGSDPTEMGHDIGELDGVQARVTGTCSSGQSIRIINADGSVECEVDDEGSGGGISCQRINSGDISGGSATASCSSLGVEYFLVGGGGECITGGCDILNCFNVPSADLNTWSFKCSGGTVRAYAVCCKNN